MKLSIFSFLMTAGLSFGAHADYCTDANGDCKSFCEEKCDWYACACVPKDDFEKKSESEASTSPHTHPHTHHNAHPHRHH